METADYLPEDPEDFDQDLAAGGPPSPGTAREGLQITGVRTVSGMRETASKFSGLFGSDSSDDGNEDFDEEDAATNRALAPVREAYGFDDSDASRRETAKGRRPSTTEAKERQPLSSDEEEDVSAAEQMERLRVQDNRSPFADPEDDEEEDSSDDDVVEIPPKRTN